MHKKLTPTQKLNALAAKFYNDAVWQPKAGDYYTSTRADLELYRVSRIEEGKIFTVYCHIECNEQGWNPDDFTTKGFGLKRVHVPDWVFDIAPLDNLLDKPATVGAVTIDRLRDKVRKLQATIEREAEYCYGWAASAEMMGDDDRAKRHKERGDRLMSSV